MQWFWILLWDVSAWAFSIAAFPHWPSRVRAWARRRMTPRGCQFCDNIISRKRDLAFGVLNCNACVHRMVMGFAPHCRKSMCDDPRHGHSV